MPFWNTTALDPKREFKFKVTFSRLGADATFLAQTADRPVWNVSGETKVDFLDKQFSFPGKVKWNDVKIKFVDASTGAGGLNVARSSYNYLSDSGWVIPNGVVNGNVQNLATIGKSGATGQAGVVTVQTLDSTGTAIDVYVLNNAFVTTVGLNPLNYGGEAILTAEYTFKYDWASYSGR